MKKISMAMIIGVLLALLSLSALASGGSSMRSAASIAFDQTYNDSITATQKEDYYKASLSESGRVTIDITSYMQYYCIVLYNDAGVKLWETDHNEWVSTTGKRSDVHHVDLEAGIYYFDFNGYKYLTYYESTGNYTFKMTFASSKANIAEPNNEIATAKPVGFGTQYNAIIAVNDKEDYYEMTLQESGRVKIDMTSFMQYYCIVLYNDAGEKLWETDHNEWVSTTGKRSDTHLLDLEAGVYYLKFDGYKYSVYYESTGNYTFKLTFTASKANIAEPNNEIATAKPVGFGTQYNAIIAVNDKEDYYEINLKESGRVRIDMTSFMQYYCIVLYNDAGERLWETDHNEWVSTTGKRSDTHLLDLEAGTYYLKFDGYKYSVYYESTGNYTFKLTFTASKANVPEPNNEIAEAKTIQLNSTYNGQIAINDKEDYYRFVLAGNKKIKLNITSYMQYYCVILYDKNGKEIWYTDHNEWNSTTGKRSDTHSIDLSSGEYFIKVNGYRYSVYYQSTGNYTFSINTNNTVPAPTSLKASSIKTNSLKLSWSGVSGAKGYVVYRFDSSKNTYSKVGTTSQRAFTVKKLKAGTTYRFAVKAYKTVSGTNYYSDYSKVLTTVTKPVGPTIKVSAGTKQATIRWKAVQGATSYIVYRGISKDGSFQKIGTT